MPNRRVKVQGGGIAVSPVGKQQPKRVPSGLIHDWVSAIFIANVTLGDLLQVVRNCSRYKDWYGPTVADSTMIDTSNSKDRFSMLLLYKSLVVNIASIPIANPPLSN